MLTDCDHTAACQCLCVVVLGLLLSLRTAKDGGGVVSLDEFQQAASALMMMGMVNPNMMPGGGGESLHLFVFRIIPVSDSSCVCF